MQKMHGGVHVKAPWPPKEKQLEHSGGYRRIEPAYVVLPMRQGPGAPAKPVVQPGEAVKIGQLVGEIDGKMGARVHASVSGTVRDLREMPEAGGGVGLAVVVDNDRRDSYAEGMRLPGEEAGMTPESIVEAVKNAGIMGMGGATFPTHIKLQPQDAVDLVIANGCECEPGLAADDALMQTDSENILHGLCTAVKAVGAQRAVVAIEDNKPGAVAAMRRAAEGAPGVEVVPLGACYPKGGEKQLVQAVAGREVPMGGLTAKAGVLVLNVATCAAIGAAVMSGAALTHRICTVMGDVKQPRNLCFPIGTPAAALIDACGGFAGTPSKVIMGGPMMGRTLEDLTVPMLKGVNGLTVLCEDADAFYTETPCIRCNACVDVCPMRLEPLFIDRAWRAGKLRRCAQLQAGSCINCGCCTYVCPARRRLAEKIVEAKNKLAEEGLEVKA